MRNRSTLQTVLSIVFFILIVVLYLYLTKGISKAPSSTNSPQTTQQSNAQYPGATAPELTSAQCHMKGVLPDPSCTPGVTNPQVTQSNIDQTICVSGYTKTIRPPVEYTDKLKSQQMNEYGFTDSIHSHEEDHLISLELGGSPSDPKNLWPEPHASPNAKDKVEDFLHAAVCDNRISLQDAQHRIATDWTTAEQGL
jgi:hypothetical protein